MATRLSEFDRMVENMTDMYQTRPMTRREQWLHYLDEACTYVAGVVLALMGLAIVCSIGFLWYTFVVTFPYVLLVLLLAMAVRGFYLIMR